MEAQKTSDQNTFSTLDGLTVPRSWEPTLARALSLVWADRPEEDKVILSGLRIFLERNAGELARLNEQTHSVKPPAGAYRTNPVGVTLLEYLRAPRAPGLSLLTAILVNAALEIGSSSSPERKAISTLSSSLRGAMEDRGSPLNFLLDNSNTIPEMVRSVELRIDADATTSNGVFGVIWGKWLRDTLTRWMLADTDRLRQALEPKTLVPDFEAPFLPFGENNQADPDDAPELKNLNIPGSESEGDEASPKTKLSLAKAEHLLRASQGDLFSPSDFLIPEEFITSLATKACTHAKASLNENRNDHAEPHIALGLIIACGLRELDLGQIIWGSSNSEKSLVIDPVVPRLYKRIKRPNNAVKPKDELKDWLEPTTDQIAWPLPPSLHQMLRQLAPNSSPIDGTTVLPLRSSTPVPYYQLRDVVAALEPCLHTGAGQIRVSLGIKLTRKFGSEVAQLALVDTFSKSVGPAYYSAVTVHELTKTVASIQSSWFGEKSPIVDERESYFGSQLVLTNQAARYWPESLRRTMRSTAHQKASCEIDAWVAQRNHLAGAFCTITASRPGDEIGRLDLDQIIPEYGLVVLRDKQSDSLRSTRIAATGMRWLADLRLFLDRLVRIASSKDDLGAAELAGQILRSEVALFTVPDKNGGKEIFTLATLKSTMPNELWPVANHFRHRLNQFLQRRHLDPELRHAQMGWVVSPAHAQADLSPLSPKQFGFNMASVLDDFAVHDGWYPASQRTPDWRWDGVPERPLKNWAEIVSQHEQEHAGNLRKLKQQLRERGEEATQLVLPRLANAFISFLPGLRLNIDTKQLERAPGWISDRAIEVTSELHALILDRVRSEDLNPEDATEAAMTRILLFRVIRQARRKGLISGPIPSRPFLSFTSDPSPFLLGLGLAVRQAEEFRKRMLERASLLRAHDMGPLALLCVLAFSPWRHLDQARAAVNAAAQAQRSRQPGDYLRVPAMIDRKLTPMVFGGIPALLLARRGIESVTAQAPTDEVLADFLDRRITYPMGMPVSTAQIPMLVELFRAAGRVELSGLERSVMLGHSDLASVSVERSIARDDHWPVRTRNQAELGIPEEKEVIYELAVDETNSPKPRTHGKDEYSQLTAALNPELLPSISGSTSDGHRGWRQKLLKQIKQLKERWGDRSNLGLIAGFAIHRLQFGGTRQRHLAHLTLQQDVTRFASDLLAIAQQQSIVMWDSDQFVKYYLAVLQGKPITVRRQAFDALVVFHEYLVHAHQVAELSFAELKKFAGSRLKFVSVGVLTDPEVFEVLKVLNQDLDDEKSRDDAQPEMIRLCELRKLKYLLLEGAGIRPDSSHGLTLGDLHLFGLGRDFLHVRTTGQYGKAKTTTSIGFIPIEGKLWNENRDWVIELLAREINLLSGTHWWKAPLFAEKSGAKRRFGCTFMTRRFDQLLKWVTGDKKGSTYWLRKNRITARHLAAVLQDEPRARHVYAVMKVSGHAQISTPLESYINDPAVCMQNSLREGRESSRSSILDVTGLDVSGLDMAWLRGGGAKSTMRLATVLDRLGIKTADISKQNITPSPPLRRASVFLPRHIDSYARLLHKFNDRNEALLRSGLTESQADRLDKIAKEMLLYRGEILWPISELLHKSAIISPARKLEGTENLFELLDKEPNEDMQLLSDIWVKKSHAERIFVDEVAIVLSSAEESEAADRILIATKLELESVQIGGTQVIRAPEMIDKTKNHTAAFQWVLGVFWIYSRFVKQ